LFRASFVTKLQQPTRKESRGMAMIPGLGQAAPTVSRLLLEDERLFTDYCQATFSAPTIAATVAVHELRAESEWRFEIAIGQKIEVRVSKCIQRSN
jgi:polyribonucleotide 5'-hydroxyl-kinase